MELSLKAKRKMIEIGRDLCGGTPWANIRNVHQVNNVIIEGVKSQLETYSYNLKKFEKAINSDQLGQPKLSTTGHGR